MTTRSIIFDAAEVRATLAGSKTRFSRIVKPQPIRHVWDWTQDAEVGEKVIYCDWVYRLEESSGRDKAAMGELYPRKMKCLFGGPGDLLVVKETWARVYESAPPYEDGDPWHIEYKADTGNPLPGEWPVEYKDGPNCGRWQSGVTCFMSRLTLRVTSVAVGRVQETSEEEAIAEGVKFGTYKPNECRTCACGAFMDLWNTRNAKPKPFRRNPYTAERELCQVAYPWDGVREETTISRKASKWHGCKVYVVGNPFAWRVGFEVVGQ